MLIKSGDIDIILLTKVVVFFCKEKDYIATGGGFFLGAGG